nr:hypothetical protein [Planctomycetota bacterium]
GVLPRHLKSCDPAQFNVDHERVGVLSSAPDMPATMEYTDQIDALTLADVAKALAAAGLQITADATK